MQKKQEHLFLAGQAGSIECVIDYPNHISSDQAKGVALVCHPHPLFGGAFDNKVTQTFARCLASQGYFVLRPNFRGVGKSVGQHDNGVGELADMQLLVKWLQQEAPVDALARDTLALAGFSFGSFIVSQLAQTFQTEKLMLAGAPPSRWNMPQLPAHAFLIHGEKDDVAPLSDVLAWLEHQHLALHVVPNCDHYFNGKLLILKHYINQYLQQK